jgi:hypothetical protein
VTNSIHKNQTGVAKHPTPSGKVHATLNYIADMDERPVFYNDDHAAGNLRFEPHDVEIEDASLLSVPPTLEANGFQLFHYETSQRNLAESPASAIEPYALELDVLLRNELGAEFVHVGRQGTRRQKAREDADQSFQALAVNYIHSDTSRPHGSQAVATQGVPEQSRPVRRMALVNFWRLVSPPPTNMPLAILDPNSVSPSDLVPADSTFKDGSIRVEMLLLRYNPAHKWYYFSQQGYDDLLAFKQFDSDLSKQWFAPHSAFLNNAVPADVIPRVNYETRAVAYWYAD